MAQAKAVFLTTPEFRMSWPNLYAPTAQNEGQTPKYSVTAIWRPTDFSDKEKALWAAIMAELDRVSKAAFGKEYRKLPVAFHKPIRDGAEVKWNGFGEGTVFARMSSLYKPGVVDRDRNLLVPSGTTDGSIILPDEVYAGAYARATTNVWSFSNQSKGLGFGVRSIQVTRDGDRLDGRVDPVDDFEDDLPKVEGDDFEDDNIPF